MATTLTNDDDRENAALYEMILAQWAWIDSDHNGRTAYKLRLAEQFGVPFDTVLAAFEEVRAIKLAE